MKERFRGLLNREYSIKLVILQALCIKAAVVDRTSCLFIAPSRRVVNI